ncbi:MAG: hypothetical protein M1825_003829 [Sarcosagium campestre]|nr:MAG: hypothetical protein M1825_003829 [Sarcosagium campestre]
MSAILSADDLNDFISPGVACIKPVETLPKQKQATAQNPYEVTTEDKLPPENLPPAEISLTDCLACSGCVTSAEAILVSLQSHAEVLNALDSAPPLDFERCRASNGNGPRVQDGKVFVASVSPQVRASLAVALKVTEKESGHIIEQLLSGPSGVRIGGKYGNGFAWTVDTNVARAACLVLGAEEVSQSSSPSIIDNATTPKFPILSSACPGWICYAEKTHPHILPHLSHLKSPQALMGTLLKTSLSKALSITPDKIWHVAVMPCFDKKLEASREELTDIYWSSNQQKENGVRDVDCVITTREIIMLAEARGIDLLRLPRFPIPAEQRVPFPDQRLNTFLFPPPRQRPSQYNIKGTSITAGGTSGGYLAHILSTILAQHPNSILETTRGRNADVLDYTITDLVGSPPSPTVIFKAARYYGFRNIQNLVRKLKPVKVSRLPGAATRRPPAGGATAASRRADAGMADYGYVEVMACPGGCTNGGAQLRPEEVDALNPSAQTSNIPLQNRQKALLAQVDEAYFSDSSDTTVEPSLIPPVDASADLVVDGISHPEIHEMLNYWADLVGVPLARLVYTSYRAVQSDVGKNKNGNGLEMERVVELAGKAGGGW